MVNKATLIGNLGRDPEIRRLENGTAVSKFSIATNENYKDSAGEWQTLTEWHEIVAWRSLAEQAERQLKKGSLVFIEGKITHRKYTDANGIERRTTEIVANTMRSLEKREGSGRDAAFPTEETPYANTRGTYTNNSSATTSQSVDFEVVPQHELTDAPSMEGGNDLPF